jgi:hypothetical protein
MRSTRILPLAFLFATFSTFAQQSATPDGSKNTSLTHMGAVRADCPLGMEATHGAGVPIGMNAGPTVNGSPIVPEASAPTLSQRIHLSLINLRSHDIASAQITAHGFSDRWKAIDLARSSQAPDLAKTLDVLLSVKGMGRASSDLSLSRFTAITSIDLNSVTYADGTTWHTPSPRACSITPDLIMLVAATR